MYDIVKNKLNNLYQKKDVVSNLEIISLYDLQEAIENVLGNFFRITNGVELEDYINHTYLENASIGTLIKRTITNNQQKLVKRVLTSISQKQSIVSIKIEFNENNGIFPFNEITINKNVSNDELFFNNNDYLKEKRKFVDNYFEIIMNHLSILEEFLKDFNLDYFLNNQEFNKLMQQRINDGFLEINLDYSKSIPKCSINLLNKEEDAVFNREWDNRPCLQKEFKKKRNLYLKKIEILVSELNPFFRKIVEINEYNKGKTLKKI